jgi:hypothetical protein
LLGDGRPVASATAGRALPRKSTILISAKKIPYYRHHYGMTLETFGLREASPQCLPSIGQANRSGGIFVPMSFVPVDRAVTPGAV